jgi:hypothetical protein
MGDQLDKKTVGVDVPWPEPVRGLHIISRHSNGAGATADRRKQNHVGGEALQEAGGGPALVPMGYISPSGLERRPRQSSQ